MNEYCKILIVRIDRIGDVVLTLPLISILKNNIPHSEISMLVADYTADLVIGNSKVKECIKIDRYNYKFWELFKIIKKRNFDSVFIVSPTFHLALIFFLLRIRRRVGTGYRWYSFLFNERAFIHRKDSKKHELEYNLDFLEKYGIKNSHSIEFDIPINDKDIKIVEDALLENGITCKDNFIIFHPGSGKSSLDLPQDKYIEIINRVSILKNIKIVLTGGKNEFTLIDDIEKKLENRVIKFVDKFNLREFSYLAKRSKIFISNSTGPIHIAAAVGTFVIGFYPNLTACSEKRWGPYTKNKIIFTPEIVPECSKCIKKKCEKFNCMSRISTYSVVQAINNHLDINNV